MHGFWTISMINKNKQKYHSLKNLKGLNSDYNGIFLHNTMYINNFLFSIKNKIIKSKANNIFFKSCLWAAQGFQKQQTLCCNQRKESKFPSQINPPMAPQKKVGKSRLAQGLFKMCWENLVWSKSKDVSKINKDKLKLHKSQLENGFWWDNLRTERITTV